MTDPAGGPAHPPSPDGGTLDRRLCQVVGVNQNYVSRTRTLYHIQIEDRGPVADGTSGRHVRRVNVIIYANYGKPNARIVFGRNHDFEDLRTREQNRFVERKISELAAEARAVIEDEEGRQIERIKGLIRDYRQTRAGASKRDLEAAKVSFPFLFSRAWAELKQERRAAANAPPPLDRVDDPLREQVIEIERVIVQLMQDLERLRVRGGADDILVHTCHKLVLRAQDGITGRKSSAFSSRYLEMTRNSLLKTWRQVLSRLR